MQQIDRSYIYGTDLRVKYELPGRTLKKEKNLAENCMNFHFIG